MTKKLKSIFSSDFQMTEEEVSIKGVMTHAPVCKSASCHWQEQLSVCSFQAVSLQEGKDWVVVSLHWEALTPHWMCCFRCGHAAVALATGGSLVPLGLMPSTRTTFTAWLQGLRWAPELALSGKAFSTSEASSLELAELGDLLSTQEVLLQRYGLHKQLS